MAIYILYVPSESMKELKKLVKTTRPKWPPNKVLESAASETSSSEEAPRSSKKTTDSKEKKREVNKMHLCILYVMTYIYRSLSFG